MVGEDLQHVPVQFNCFGTAGLGKPFLDKLLVLGNASFVNDEMRIHSQNFNRSSKLTTQVDLRSIASNIFCLAPSFSASFLNNSESAGVLDKVAAASISFADKPTFVCVCINKQLQKRMIPLDMRYDRFCRE